MGQRALEVHPEAVAEIRAAHLRYAEHSAETSKRFFDEVEAGLERIVELFETWPSYLHGTRRFLLRRFPFSIVYRVRRKHRRLRVGPCQTPTRLLEVTSPVG